MQPCFIFVVSKSNNRPAQVVKVCENKMATTYFIFEKWSQTTLKGSQTLRSTDGFEAFDYLDAENESEVIGKWLSAHSDSYDIISEDEQSIEEFGSDRKPNAYYQCASEALVWEPGDTTADFGDFVVKAYTKEEVLERPELLAAALKTPAGWVMFND